MRAPGEPHLPAPLQDAPPDPVDRAGVVERPVKGPWLQWRHPFVFEWNTARLPVPGLPPALAGLRIVHVTDLHLRKRWRSNYDDLLGRIGRDPPDLLLCTGDFVDNKRNHAAALPTLYRLLEGFRARLGCFGILGNHDRYHFAPRLEGTNVRLLDGAREVLTVGDAQIELIGLPGVDRRDLTPEFVNALPPRDATPPGTLRIVMSHFPDHLRRTEALRPDLFLAGHTHGGQVCLPGRVPLIKHDSLPRRLVSGVHRVGPTWLVVTRGIGTTTLPLRVFCPPEVMEIRLEGMEGMAGR